MVRERIPSFAAAPSVRRYFQLDGDKQPIPAAGPLGAVAMPYSRSALPAQFDAIAQSWDAEHGPASVRAREFDARIRYLRARCRDLGRPRVLDLGCGTGQTLLYLIDLIAAGTGVDISRGMIACAQRRAAATPLQFRAGDAAAFCMKCPWRFELVLLIGALEHFPDQAAALTAVERVLSADGQIIIITPHPWNPVFWLNRLIERGEAPTSSHLSPLRLKWLAQSHRLKLSAVRALPYAPWPSLAAELRSDPPESTRAAGFNLFRGIMRGAFAAEFCRDGRTRFVDPRPASDDSALAPDRF
jgi:SAM-dependent methyltransferase